MPNENMKVRWSKVSDPNDWGKMNSIYFPFAEQFLRHCPWLAVRVFWATIKVKDFFNGN
jgi:hypothetical protein